MRSFVQQPGVTEMQLLLGFVLGFVSSCLAAILYD